MKIGNVLFILGLLFVTCVTCSKYSLKKYKLDIPEPRIKIEIFQNNIKTDSIPFCVACDSYDIYCGVKN
jgi:hypothetical protein